MTTATFNYDVFISYARKDGEAHAQKLEQVLPNTWRDKRGINPSQDFTAEIERAIRESRQVVICITPDVMREDSFVRQEVAYAVYLKKPIIVTRFEEVPPPLPVFNHTWLDFFKIGWDDGLKELKALLGRFSSGVYVPPPAPDALAADPYCEYLGDLYDGIVSYLDQTVIRLIDVMGKVTPDAVARRHNPLASFKARAGINDEGQPVASVNEGMAKYKGRVLLLGEPGAGKTTALMSYARQRVSDRLNDPTQPLPILLRCAEWESSPPLPLDAWAAKATGLADHDLAAQPKLLLLDGLDELGASRTEKIKEVDREIERSYDPRKRFLEQLPPGNGEVLLSCRVQDYAEIHEQAKLNGAVTLQPLTDEQIQEYLHDLPDLWTALQADAGLLEIARTPLLLSFFAYGFKDAPQEAQSLRDLSKAQLGDKIFERYVHERYAHEERRLLDMGETPAFTLETLYEVLGHVAMINASGGWRTGSHYNDEWREIQDNILLERDFLEKLAQVQISDFIDFATRLNLLAVVENSLRFVHLHLRDHLVRRYCRLPYRSGGRLLSGYTGLSFSVRFRPLFALCSLPNGESIDALLELLKSDEEMWRSAATTALGKSRHSSAIKPLITILQQDVESNVRASAASGLGQIGGDEAEAALINSLQSDTDSDVRVSAARALSRIGGEQSMQALIASLQDEMEPKMLHYAAVWGLGRIGGDQSLKLLITLLQSVAHKYLHNHIVEALEMIGTSEALEAVQKWREAEELAKQQLIEDDWDDFYDFDDFDFDDDEI